jgi:hypothetical protein
MKRISIVTAHAGAASFSHAIESWCAHAIDSRKGPLPDSTGTALYDVYPMILVMDGRGGMLPAYQNGLKNSSAEIIAYLHDDTIIKDSGWVARVLKEFEDPNVGLVGFGGATRHGDPGMYRKEYEYSQLARAGFASNMRDAENHGERFTGSKDVAVLDGFALIVRRQILEDAGGWPLNTPIGYVCYDYWLSCMTRRLGKRIRLVGVECDHLGGQTFVKMGIGDNPKHWQQYIDSHRYIYDEFKDVLPHGVPR